MRRIILFSTLLLFCVALAALLPLGALAAIADDDDVDDLGIAKIESPKDKDSFGLNDKINFTAYDSGNIIYIWNFGDGSPLAYGRIVEHSYEEYSEYTVILTCIDEQGRWDNDSIVIKVLGTLSGYPMWIQIVTTICCLMPFFLPFVLLIVISIALKYIVRAAAHIDWKVKHLTILGLVIISMPVYLIVMMLVLLVTFDLKPLLLICGSIIAGSVVWIGVGFLCIFPLSIAVRVLMKLPLDFKDGLCIVRKALPIEKKLVGERKRFSLKNFLEFVCDLSLNPLFLTFFIITATAVDLRSPLDFFNMDWITLGPIEIPPRPIMLILAPLITFIVIPLQILMDSYLMYVKKDKKSGILMLYLGATFKNVLQSLLGVGAIAAFIFVFLNIGSGAELDQIFYAFIYLLVIIPIIYPGIFIVTCIYSLFHNTFVKKFNDQLDKIVLKEYRIKEHKNDTRFVAMVPITYQTQTLEQIQKNKELSERRIS